MNYTAIPARYAKNMIAVQCPSNDGWKTPEAFAAEKYATRYTKREKAYLMTPAAFKKFEQEFTCNHPPARLYSWPTFDGSMAVCCCACGAVLKG